MLINSVTAVYFSPTGTTKKIMNAIINGMGAEDNEIIDITLPQARRIIYRPKFVVANVLKMKSRVDKEPKIFL